MSQNKRGAKKPLSKQKQLMRNTTKAERQALKAAKKEKQLKPKAVREAEIKDIKDQLAKWDINERFESFEQLFKIMDDFVETGEAKTGSIFCADLPPFGRRIEYTFPKIRNNRCVCDLIVPNGEKYIGDVVSRNDLPHLEPPGASDEGRRSNQSPNHVKEAEYQKFVEEYSKNTNASNAQAISDEAPELVQVEEKPLVVSYPSTLPSSQVESEMVSVQLPKLPDSIDDWGKVTETVEVDIEKSIQEKAQKIQQESVSLSVEEAFAKAKAVVPSVEEIQKFLDDALFSLSGKSAVKTQSSVEIVDESDNNLDRNAHFSMSAPEQSTPAMEKTQSNVEIVDDDDDE